MIRAARCFGTSFVLELACDLLQFGDVSRDNVKGTWDAVVISGALLPDFEPLVAALKAVVPVVLAVVRFLDVVYLCALDY